MILRNRKTTAPTVKKIISKLGYRKVYTMSRINIIVTMGLDTDNNLVTVERNSNNHIMQQNNITKSSMRRLRYLIAKYPFSVETSGRADLHRCSISTMYDMCYQVDKWENGVWHIVLFTGERKKARYCLKEQKARLVEQGYTLTKVTTFEHSKMFDYVHPTLLPVSLQKSFTGPLFSYYDAPFGESYQCNNPECLTVYQSVSGTPRGYCSDACQQMDS
jgi:hypothetical protein